MITSQKILKSINPSNCQVIGSVESSTIEDVEEAFKKAEESFNFWRKMPIEDRIVHVKKVGEIIYDERDEIAELITEETGKPIMESYSSEIISSLDAISFYCKKSKKFLKREKVRFYQPFLWGKKGWIEYEPYGPIALISPWNYPFSIPIVSIVPIVIAGNTLIFKPSEFTPLTGKKIEEIFKKAGFPEGVLNFLYGDGEIGKEILKQPVKKVFFTGSTQTGKEIMKLCAERLIPVVFELGGKDPMIVLKDANIETTAESALWGSLFNCGQTCCSVERIYVEKEIVEPFIQKIIESMKKLNIGIDFGPVQNRKQLSKVREHLEDAISKGGKIVYQIEIKENEGLFFPPTLLYNLNEDMKCIKEETFGPMIRIISVENWKEAIKMANSSSMGLSASIWTNDLDLAKNIAREIQAGTVWINNLLYSYNATQCPWGGVKESGIGRVHGKFALLEATYPKVICFEKGRKRSELWWFPYNEKKLKLLRDGISFLFKKGIKRFKLIPSLIKWFFGEVKDEKSNY